MRAARYTRWLLALTVFVTAVALGGSVWRDLDSGPPPAFAGFEPPAAVSVAIAGHDAAGDLEQLQARVHTIAAGRLGAGLSLALVEDGRVVWTTGLGLADVAAGRPATADTMYRVGSLSKPVLALTLASLEADGLLDLDAPVRGLVGDVAFENAWEDTHAIRLTELLQHTAGFDEMRFNETFATADQLGWSPARVLALNSRSRRARWYPGMRHAYSHPGYTLAGHVVERVTGQPFEAVVRERIFDPLGMPGASYRPTAEVEAELAVPYSGQGLERLEQWLLHHRPGSHLYASARELGRFVALLAGRGVVDGRRVVPERIVERLEQGTPQQYPDLVPNYGLGIHSFQYGGAIWFGHGGWMPGYFSGLRYLPAARSGYVLLTNEAWDRELTWKIESELFAYVQRKAESAAPVPRVELEPAALAALAGTYQSGNHHVEFIRAFDLQGPTMVDVVGGDLRLRHCDGESAQLVPVGDGRFRRTDQTQASILFATSPDGTPVLHDGNRFGYYERIPAVMAVGFHVLCLFVLAALGLGVLWPAIWLIPALRSSRPLALRAWPSAGSWCVCLFVATLYHTPVTALAALNGRTAAIFVFSWAIPICAVASVITTASALRHRRGGVGARVTATLATAGLALAALHLARHGMFGVRTWLW